MKEKDECVNVDKYERMLMESSSVENCKDTNGKRDTQDDAMNYILLPFLHHKLFPIYSSKVQMREKKLYDNENTVTLLLFCQARSNNSLPLVSRESCFFYRL